MLTVDDYAKIRLARRDGLSIREIARTFGHSRRKVREALACPQPQPHTRTKPPPAPVLGTSHAVIDAILADDEQAPPSSATPPCSCSAACATSTPTQVATTRSAATSSGGA